MLAIINSLPHVSPLLVFALSPRSSDGGKTGGDTNSLPVLPAFKRPWSVTETSSISSKNTPRSTTPSSFFSQKKPKSGPVTQMKLWGNAIDPNAPARMDVAISDFIHSHCLPFSLAQDPKLMNIIEEVKKYAHVYLRTHDWTQGVKSIFCAPGRSYQRACH